jgi:uracil phosphoribosyltransferase
MANFIHHDLIAEKLEIARTIGLVTDYLIAPADPAHRSEAIVKIWRSPKAPEGQVRQYLAHLLDGLVSDHEIVLDPVLATAAAIGQAAVQNEAAPIPVAVQVAA